MAYSRSDVIRAALQQGSGERPSVDPDNLRLAQSIRRGLNRLGEPVPEQTENNDSGGFLGSGLSLLGRAFDVASRPLYGVTNVIENMQNEGVVEGITGAGGQLWQGLSGQDKVTGSDLIENAGIENGVAQGLGGFALDVALDPLSYVGLGVVKQVAKETAEAGGMRVAQSLIKEADTGGTAMRIARYGAEKEARQNFLRQGFSLLEANAGAKTVGDEFVADAAGTAARTEFNRLLNEGQGRIALKYMGREIGSTERGYRAAKKVSDFVSGTRLGTSVNKAFRPSATFVAGSNTEKRIAEAVGMANLEADGAALAGGGAMRVGRREFPGIGHLTEDEAVDLAHGIENWDYDGALNPEVKATRQLIRDIGIDEQGTFVTPDLPIQQEELIDNYLHHSFDMSKDTPVQVAAWKAARKKDIDKVIGDAINEADELTNTWARQLVDAGEEVTPEMFNAKRREFFDNIPKLTKYTLAKAKDEGLHPIEDGRLLLGNHLQDHYRKNTRVAFLNAMVGEFGNEVGEGAAANAVARQMDLIPVSSKGARKFLPETTRFPREIAKAIDQMDRIFYTDDAAGQGLLNVYDKALGYLKVGQTVVNPGFHVRNMGSDVALNYMDGVVDPRPYGDAFSILKARKKSIDDFSPDPLIDHPDPVKEITENLDDIKIDVNGTEVSGRDMYRMFETSGAKSGYYRSEVVVGKGGGVIEKLRKVSETREDFARLAHFIDAFRKEAGKLPPVGSSGYQEALSKAAKKAGERVRKFNIDYGDLTPMEQRVMKRIVPFYTWMRKNIPLQIESLFMRPGRQMVFPKIIRNLQAMLGQDPSDTDIVGINSLPDYMRAAMYVNVLGEGQGQNGVYWNPGGFMPIMDLNQFFGTGSPGDIVERQLSGLTPAAQIPIQQTTGYNFFTGRPQNKSLPQNLLELTPAGRYGYGITQEGDPIGSTALLNLLGGAGLTSLNDGMQRGELRRQEDIVQRLLRERQASQ